MRSVMTIVFASVAGATLLVSRAGSSQGLARAESGQPLVRITAQQLTESPPSYAFLVTNLSNTPISSIVIGRRELTFPISGVAPNVPARIESPQGWVGRHGFVEERPFLTYHWETTDPSKRIMPQQSAAGFRITLPDARKDPVQVTFDRTPFEVAPGGAGSAGLVGLDRIPK